MSYDHCMRWTLIALIAALTLSSCARTGTSRERRGLLEIEAGRNPSSRSYQTYAEEDFEEFTGCSPLTHKDRERLLSVADPSNYPKTRYRMGPRARNLIERETDCSHFVHEVYRRAGLPFSFRSSRQLKNAPEFELVPEAHALPGDLMLFRGHVGIVDEDGQIISATRTRKRDPASSIKKMDRSNFPGFRGKRYVLRYRCRPKAVSGLVSENSPQTHNINSSPSP